jgi:DNA repair ATPase RecN
VATLSTKHIQKALTQAQQATAQLKQAMASAQSASQALQSALEQVKQPLNVSTKKKTPVTPEAAKRIQRTADQQPKSLTAQTGFADRLPSLYAWDDDD